MTKKNLIKQNPTVVKKLANGAEYIPIGHVEQELDILFPDWSTGDFKFQIIEAGKMWIADASCMLYVGNRHMQGAVSFPISSKDENLDFSATALSFCIANAAKRLGIRLGRGLNGRIDAGETALPIIQKKEALIPDASEEAAWKVVKDNLTSYEWKEDAQVYLDSTGYSLTIEAKKIVNGKPSKKSLMTEIIKKADDLCI